MERRLTRAEVPVAETWNLGDLFPTEAAWEAEYAAIAAAIPSVTGYKGRLHEGAAVMLACLETQEKLYERYIRLDTYAGLRGAEDGSNPVNQGLMARGAGLRAEIESGFAFVRSEILALPDGTVEQYLQTEPGLAPFRHHFEAIMETKPYILSPETEETLAALGEVHEAPFMIYERAKNSDIRLPSITDENGQEVAMSLAMFEDHYEQSSDTPMRRKAWDSFTKGLAGFQNTLAATFATEVKKNVVLARVRGYDSTTHMLLAPHRVPLDVYHNLLNIIQAELAPHMRRYARLRKRVLGLDQMLYCDIKAPLDPAYNPPTTFAEASSLILEALSIMGPEYSRILKNALTERWVDLPDNEGKMTGAFCATPYGAHSFILMTWTDAMRSAFVLAHELGHAGHFGLANTYQRLVNTEPSMFFVEAPSTINELLLGQHILAKSQDQRMRRWVIMQFLGTYHHNYITHLLEAELQRRIYKLAEEGTPITAATLSEVKGEILKGFWGDTVTIDEGARLTWMRQPHYYMGLYPYTYSAGLTAATAMAQAIREEGQPAVNRWLDVLKAGGTMKPLELMQHAGIDMSNPEPIRKAVAYVGSLVDELEKSFM